MHKRLKYLNTHFYDPNYESFSYGDRPRSTSYKMYNVRFLGPLALTVYFATYKATSYIFERSASFCSGYGSTDLLPEGKFQFLIVRSELICR